MTRKQTAEMAFATVLAAWGVFILVYYPQTPEHLASHFNGQGVPNGWSSKSSFYGLTFGIMAMMVVTFLWLPRQRWFFNHKTRNLPNRDYWFVPERAEKTSDYLKAQWIWLGVASIALHTVVMYLAVDANLNPPPRLSTMAGWFIVGYFVYVAVWLVQLFSRFRCVQDESHPV